MRILAGDLGGTKVNLAIHPAGGGAPLVTETYPSEGPGLAPILGRFLDRATEYLPVSAAALGVAGPCFEGRSHLPNLGWDLDEGHLSAQLDGAPVRLMNDLVATAHGVLQLPREQVEVLQGSWPPPRGPAAVLAPGTGLGVCPVPWIHGRHHPVPAEIGHTDLAPGREDEQDLVRFLRARHGVATWERAVSGLGLPNLYDFWRERLGVEGHPQVLSAMEAGPGPVIARLAEAEEDPVSGAVMDMFVRLLGRLAGNVALQVLTRGGIFLGGGIPPKILPFLRRPELLAGFHDRDPMGEFLREVPLYVSLDPSAAVQGAVRVARQLAATT